MTRPESSHEGAVTPLAEGGVAQRLRDRAGTLSPTEASVATYFLEHGADTVLLSAVELGKRTGTSDATVIRTAKSLGYSGLPELKLELGVELMSSTAPAARLAGRIDAARESEGRGMLELIVEEAHGRLDETLRHFDAESFDRLASACATAPRVHVFGVGVSRVAAEYTTMRLGRLGIPTHFARNMGFALADDLLAVQRGDLFIIINPGREIRDIDAIFERCRAVGATTALMTAWAHAPSFDDCDIVLRAPDTAAGLSGEVLTSILLIDHLVLELAKRDEVAATEYSKNLTALRKSLLKKQTRARSSR